MSRSVHRREGQATLGVGSTQDTSASVPCIRVCDLTRSIGHDERLNRVSLESPSAVPGHVLNGRQCAVHEEQVIIPSMSDNDVVCGLDDLGQGAQGAGDRTVTLRENVTSTDRVVGGWSVQDLLHIRSVEVIVGATSKRWETHHIPQVRAEVGEMVHVEAWVDKRRGAHDIVPHLATISVGVWSRRKFRGRWVGQNFVEVLGEAAFLVALVDILHESVVEVEDGGEVVQRGDGRGYIYLVC